MKIEQIAVVGAGTMGTNIALDFARAGYPVTLHDTYPEQLAKSSATLRTNLALLADEGLLSDPVDAVSARVRGRADLAAAVAGADLVVEAVPEVLALKQELYGRLEPLVRPDTLLASNTSAFLPSSLAERVERRERLLVAHYWNPAHLVPLVELVPGPETDPAHLETLRRFYTEIGKKPVVMRREKLGFIGNRLQFALYREAVALLAEGTASVEDIDTTVRYSFGRRMPATGLFRTHDMAGLDVMLAICNSLFPDLADNKSAPPLLEGLVEEGRLGAKTGAGYYDYPAGEADAWRRALAEELIRRARLDAES